MKTGSVDKTLLIRFLFDHFGYSSEISSLKGYVIVSDVLVVLTIKRKRVYWS